MDIRAILAGLTFALLWSSAFTSARIIVESAPPLYSLSLRFWASGGIAVLIALALGQSWRLTPAQWRATIIFGICQNGIYLGLNFVAMQWVEASLASIIASTMPLLVALAILVLWREKLPALGIIGLVAGVGGVVLIMATRLSGGVDLLGVLYCTIAVIALATATLMIRGASSGGNLMMVVGLQMLIAAVLLLVPASLLESPADVTYSYKLVAAFVYTTIFPGLIATYIWFWLVGRIGATKASTFHFLNPVFGVAVAAWLLGEKMTYIDALGVAIVAIGILMVQLAKQRV